MKIESSFSNLCFYKNEKTILSSSKINYFLSADKKIIIINKIYINWYYFFQYLL